MTALNDADDLKLGSQQVDAVYLGAEEVWPGTPPSHFVGGLEWVEDGYRYHKFRLAESGDVLTFMGDRDNTPVDVEYCIVGGGGAGGSVFGNAATGSGGGGGGVLTGTASLSTDQLIVVGKGGVASAYDAGDGTKPAKTGKNSSLGALIAYGGGPGYDNSAYFTPPDGGCGGGGRNGTTPGAGVAGQGFSGGTGAVLSGLSNNGGGGGAGGNGQNNTSTSSGAGGPGKEWPAGSGEYYGGGGGGGSNGGWPAALGGVGGGGDGSATDYQPGQNGEDGRGGGGGGCGRYEVGGQGGDGVVIVRYLENAKFPPVSPDQPLKLLGGIRYWEDGYLYAKFAQSDTLKVYQPITPVDIEYLVVAGGGGGGGGATQSTYTGGGGGAGGYRTGMASGLDGSIVVVVGAGGTGNYQKSTVGGNSKLDTIEAAGGGGGASRDGVNYSEVRNGGSGGGAYSQTNASSGAGLATPAGQGSNGQSANYGSITYTASMAGGGGGATQRPPRPSWDLMTPGADTGGKGGRGIEWPTGSGQRYAGGGGGANWSDYQATDPGVGGQGGGGCGQYKSSFTNKSPGCGADGYGGGGGGVEGAYQSGAFGGSGVVIVRTPIAVDPFPTPDLEAMTGTLRYWFDAADNSTLTIISGNEVNRWDDKSAAGIARGCYLNPYNARPYLATSLLGKQAIDFYQRHALLPVNKWVPPDNSGTLIIVCETTTAAAPGQMWAGSNANSYYGVYQVSANNVRNRFTVKWSSSEHFLDENSWRRLSDSPGATGVEASATKFLAFRQAKYSPGGDQTWAFDDLNLGLRTRGFYNSNQSGYDLAAIGGNASGGSAYQGKIMEILQWDDWLPDEELEVVGEYLRRKWVVV